MKIQLTIVNRSGRSVPKKFLEDWTAVLARELTKRLRLKGQRELVIAFVTNAEIQKLNRTYRGKNKPTDVLSFQGEAESLGELAISPEIISKQAREHGLLVRHELGYMVLHGVLHLLGYDHEASARGAKVMFSLQDDVFEALMKAN